MLIFFLHRCSQIRIFTHLWNIIYTGVEEGSPATLPPVVASLAKGALMASSAVASLAVSVLLLAAVARTKKCQLQREDDEDDLCEKDRQRTRPRREEMPVDHPTERDCLLVAFGGTFVDVALSRCRAAATATPPPSCCRRHDVALPPPLQPPRCCHLLLPPHCHRCTVRRRHRR